MAVTLKFAPVRERLPKGPLVTSLFLVRARCEFGHEWLTTMVRSYLDSGVRRPPMTQTVRASVCPNCGRPLASFTDRRHG